MSDADRFLKWLEDAGKHWDTVRPEDVMRELGRTDERDKRDERIRELEAVLRLVYGIGRISYESFLRPGATSPIAGGPSLLERIEKVLEGES